MDPVERPQTEAPPRANEVGAPRMSDADAPRTNEVAEAVQSYLTALRTAGQQADGSAAEYLALEEVAEIVGREQDAGRLASGSLKKARSLLDLATLRLYRVDDRRGELRLVASHDESPGPTEGADFARGLDAFRNRRHRGSVSVEEIVADRRTVEGGGVAYSVLSVPIFNVDELWGVLQAAAPSQRGFRPSEARIVEMIAGLVGVGILRLEGIERQAALQARIERKSARVLELHRRLRDVRAELDERNRSFSQALENLRDVERLKDAFVSSISHEMRTPLTIIRGYIDLMLQY